MWIADKWKDYEILDCGNGEKLERWQNQVLVRPDPQAIWQKSEKQNKWNNANGVYSRSSSGGGHWSHNEMPDRWTVNYGELVFNIKPMNFKHTGLFPEQAVNWDFAANIIKNAKRPLKVLNLFAYTGGATISAAHAGAEVCHVDASKGMVNWAKENAKSSGLENAKIRYIVDDCKKFLEREIRRGNKYDGIIMDPPSYGRGPNGEIWKIENQIEDFVKLASEVLVDDPSFVMINSYTTGLAPSVMKYILAVNIAKKFGGTVECNEIGLPVTSTGLALPCGSTARFIGENI